jgi:hypothetical protein
MELVYCKKVDATQAVALQLVEKLSAVFRHGGGVFTVHAFMNLPLSVASECTSCTTVGKNSLMHTLCPS